MPKKEGIVYIKTKFFLLVCCILAFISYRQSSAEISITLEATPEVACAGYSISFSVNSECNLGNATFYWTFGDGSGNTTYVPYTSHAYDNQGIFNASVLVVKSGDSGSDDITISIYKLGSFAIDAERVYDTGNPLHFHIHAWKTVLKDINGNDWNPVPQYLHVLYQWFNCWDDNYYSSGHVSEYTFDAIFRWDYPDATAVKGIVYPEYGPGSIQSDYIMFYLSQQLEE